MRVCRCRTAFYHPHWLALFSHLDFPSTCISKHLYFLWRTLTWQNSVGVAESIANISSFLWWSQSDRISQFSGSTETERPRCQPEAPSLSMQKQTAVFHPPRASGQESNAFLCRNHTKVPQGTKQENQLECAPNQSGEFQEKYNRKNIKHILLSHGHWIVSSNIVWIKSICSYFISSSQQFVEKCTYFVTFKSTYNILYSHLHQNKLYLHIFTVCICLFV